MLIEPDDGIDAKGCLWESTAQNRGGSLDQGFISLQQPL
jgi:hypothetical protein